MGSSYYKSKVYVNNPTTTRALQEEIKHCINEIQTATVNGVRYRDVITQFFLPKFDDIDVANM